MTAQELLARISDYCRRTGLAESTFGRRAVNDGKLANRLRNGGRITTETVDRIEAFMETHRQLDMAARGGGPAAARPAPAKANLPSANLPTANPVTAPLVPGAVEGAVHDAVHDAVHGTVAPAAPSPPHPSPPPAPPPPGERAKADPQRNFRFFDNRQKYLLFVNTCSEKWVVAHRVAQELVNIHPRPPAVRLFDAGVGDGTVLARVMRAMHDRFAAMPFYVVGKEISLEDVRLALQKMPDRFVEHPATALVLTNLAYADAPWLHVRSVSAASSLVWHELALSGTTAAKFEEQITNLEPFLAENWKAGVSPKTGNPVYERPVVLVIYRGDHRFLLDHTLPHPGGTKAAYDLVIASQPYRARSPLEFKTRRVIAPLARALGPGGRLIAIHSHGGDPGHEIVEGMWPGDNPFVHDRHQIMKALKQELGQGGRELNFNVNSDSRSIFRYDMHTLPSEVDGAIGTSTLFAAWNAAIYVAQVEDDRLAAVVGGSRYLDVTREVLRRHGGLWFFDESYVISRRRT